MQYNKSALVVCETNQFSDKRFAQILTSLLRKGRKKLVHFIVAKREKKTRTFHVHVHVTRQDMC